LLSVSTRFARPNPRARAHSSTRAMVARDDAENDREQRDPFELLAPIARRAPRERERATVKADEDAERISTTKTNARRAETTTEGVKTRADEDIEDVTARVRALEAIAREGFAEMSAALKTLTGQVAVLSERVEALSTASERFEAAEEDEGSGSYDDDYEEYYEECPPPPPPRRGDRGPTPRRHGPPPRGGHGPPPHERGPPPHERGPPPHRHPPPHERGPPHRGPPPPHGPPHGYGAPPPHGSPHGYGAPPPPFEQPRPESPAYPTAYPAYTPIESSPPPPPPASAVQTSGAVPLEHMIADFGNMGFSREQVLGVVGEMAATGKKIEVNSVLDKLMRGV
jgi:hypothetical protein